MRAIVREGGLLPIQSAALAGVSAAVSSSSDLGLRPVRFAFLSLYDKGGLQELAACLARHGAEFVSSGGTAKALRDLGHQVTEVSQVTGAPEVLGGRVKTLHPKIHAGILARPEDADEAVLDEMGVRRIDLVCVNLYPFLDALAGGEQPPVEMIDIGGPASLRAAAKNHAACVAVGDRGEYAALMEELDANGGATGAAFRRGQAARVFAMCAAYDAAVASWMADAEAPEAEARAQAAARLAGGLVGPGRTSPLRYGENPHQAARLHRLGEGGVPSAQVLQGKELSYNNILDADSAYACLRHLGGGHACAIVKHANPCGVAVGASQGEAWQKALATDSTSAFGGIIAFSRPLEADTAQAILDFGFVEVIMAPQISPQAAQLLAKRKALRLLELPLYPPGEPPMPHYQSVQGGLLEQEQDSLSDDPPSWQLATAAAPTEQQRDDLAFAFLVCRQLKSNAVVFARDGATLGLGGGQSSRVSSVRIAVQKAEEAGLSLQGSVLASDAFFPFSDGLELALDAGATAVVQPGGSRRDDEVIAAADARGAAMLLSGRRHFRH